jgi:hypothetical protein
LVFCSEDKGCDPYDVVFEGCSPQDTMDAVRGFFIKVNQQKICIPNGDGKMAYGGLSVNLAGFSLEELDDVLDSSVGKI